MDTFLSEGNRSEVLLESNPCICNICLGPIESAFTFPCNIHKFCTECIQQYIGNKINISDVEEITCPQSGCSFTLDEDHIKLLLTEKDFERYFKFCQRAKIIKIPNTVICPIPDCNSYAIKSDNTHNNDTFLFCVHNNHEFCHKCFQEAHPDTSCDSKLESDFKVWAGKEKVKKCPKCLFYIQKNEGCNHMTCANATCKYEFCWICKSKYSHGHYNNILFPCWGLQNTSQNSLVVRHPWLRYFRTFIIIVLSILLFVLSIVFCTAAVIFTVLYRSNIFYKMVDTVNYNKRNYMKFFTIVMAVFLSVIFLPVGYMLLSLFIATLPFIAIYFAVQTIIFR